MFILVLELRSLWFHTNTLPTEPPPQPLFYSIKVPEVWVLVSRLTKEAPASL